MRLLLRNTLLALAYVAAFAVPNSPVQAHSGQWQQIAGAPHVLSAVEVVKRDNARLFEVTADQWTQWHIPAPGILAVQLPGGEDPHKVLDVYHSNGSGLLTPALFSYDDQTRLWTLNDAAYGHRMVHVRARDQRIALEAFYLAAEGQTYRTLEDIRSSTATRRQVREHLLKLGQSYFALEPQRDERFDVRGKKVIRLRLRVPFRGVPRSWQDLRLHIKADGQTIDTPTLRFFQDRRRPWFVDGKTVLLSGGEDYLVELPPGTRQLSLTSTHQVLARLEAVQREPYLFPSWNEENNQPMSSGEDPVSAVFARQATWQEITSLVQDNLVGAAPLYAVQILNSWPADTHVQRFISSIWSRYTDLLDLLPTAEGTEANFKAKYLEYRGPRLLHPDESRARRWLGAAQLSSAANKAPGAWFVQVESGQTVEVPTSNLPYASRLRVITERFGAQPSKAAAVEIDIHLPDTKQRLLLDPNQAAPSRHDPARTSTWSQGFKRITADQVAYTEIAVPSDTSTIRLSNNGTHAVWIALQQRVPRKHRHSESDWAWLLMEHADALPDLWQQAWQAGLTASGSWQAQPAQDALRKQPIWTIINGWLPTLHYLGEQHAQFSARSTTAVTNPHCSDGTAGQTSLWQARRWEQRQQWINAAEQWRALLPQLQGPRCIQAHQALADNMLRVGAHQLAETYLQTLVKQSTSQAVRNMAANWLLDYYQSEQISHRAVQLTTHMATAEPTPAHLQNLVHALFDAGQERAGLDLALAIPALRSDQRVWATLVKHGWTGLFAQLRDRTQGAGFDPAAFAQLETVRTSALEDLSFGDSVMVDDHLLGESRVQLTAKPNAPLSFVVNGPAQMRVSMRPFADADAQPQRQAWAVISVNGEQLPQPLSLQNNIARYHTAANESMGGLTQTELSLSPGEHRITIDSPTLAIAVALHKRAHWHHGLSESLLITDQRVSVLPGGLAADRIPKMSARTEPDSPVLYSLPKTPAEQNALLHAVPDGAAAGRQLMQTLAYLVESDRREDNGYAERAEWWADRAATDRKTAALRSRMRRASRWQPVEIAQNQAGIYVHELDRFTPESEHWRLRNLFLPRWQSGENLLSSGQQLNLAFEVGHPTALRIDAEHLTLPGHATQTMQLTIRHQEQDKSSSLAPDGPHSTTILELDPGAHQIEVAADGSSKSSVLKVALAQLIDNQWQPITRTLRRRFFVAEDSQAVAPDLRGPAWLRIDRLEGAHTVSRYEYLAAGQSLTPLDAIASAPTYYRILVRRPDDIGDVIPVASQFTPTATSWRSQTDVAGGSALAWHSTQATAVRGAGITRHAAPTYSLTNAWHADNDARQDGRFPVDDFFETIASRRKRDATGRNYDETNLYLRQREAGDSVGASYYRWHAFEDAPLTLRGDARLFAQRLEGHWHWSAQARMALRHRLRATARRRHSSEISAFARYVSEDDGSTAYDPDVYTSYRRDHLNGVEAKHTVYWQSHEDAEWYGGVSVRSNELSQASVDHVRMRWGNRLQLDRVQLGAEYQLSHYFSDQDRNDSLNVPRLKLRGRWYGKPTARGRLELSSELRYDFDIHRTSGLIRLTWHFDRDQALNDLHGERYWLDNLLERQLKQRERP